MKMLLSLIPKIYTMLKSENVVISDSEDIYDVKE